MSEITDRMLREFDAAAVRRVEERPGEGGLETDQDWELTKFTVLRDAIVALDARLDAAGVPGPTEDHA